MELSVTNEVYVFFGTVAGGFLLGTVNDFYKSLKCKKTGKIIFIGLSDIILCVILALFCFGIILFLNDGKIRWYEIFGIFIGYVLYTVTISKYILKLFEMLKIAALKFLIMLSKPIISMFKMLCIPVKRVKSIIKTLKRCIKSVKNKQKTKFRQIKYIFKKI